MSQEMIIRVPTGGGREMVITINPSKAAVSVSGAEGVTVIQHFKYSERSPHIHVPHGDEVKDSDGLYVNLRLGGDELEVSLDRLGINCPRWGIMDQPKIKARIYAYGQFRDQPAIIPYVEVDGNQYEGTPRAVLSSQAKVA